MSFADSGALRPQKEWFVTVPAGGDDYHCSDGDGDGSGGDDGRISYKIARSELALQHYFMGCAAGAVQEAVQQEHEAPIMEEVKQATVYQGFHPTRGPQELMVFPVDNSLSYTEAEKDIIEKVIDGSEDYKTPDKHRPSGRNGSYAIDVWTHSSSMGHTPFRNNFMSYNMGGEICTLETFGTVSGMRSLGDATAFGLPGFHTPQELSERVKGAAWLEKNPKVKALILKKLEGQLELSRAIDPIGTDELENSLKPTTFLANGVTPTEMRNFCPVNVATGATFIIDTVSVMSDGVAPFIDPHVPAIEENLRESAKLREVLSGQLPPNSTSATKEHYDSHDHDKAWLQTTARGPSCVKGGETFAQASPPQYEAAALQLPPLHPPPALFPSPLPVPPLTATGPLGERAMSAVGAT